MNSNFFIKYLKDNDFPNKNYTALTSYPDTKIINGKQVSYFTNKYKKKFLYSHEDKNTITNSMSKKLFNESFKYISDFQHNLLKKNIENYISGGAAQKLYSILYNVQNNERILTTKDYDFYLYYDCIKIDNNIILTNTINIIDSIVEINKFQNYAFIELYILINYENQEKFDDIIKIFLESGYDLNTYLIKNNNTYEFRFLKLINKELCIRLRIKILNLENLIKEKIYSYTKITYYYIEKVNNIYRTVNKYIPIELSVKNKRLSNIDIMKNSITINNKEYFIYNLNTILYNLMHMYYKYNYNTENAGIIKKKEEKKNIRDKKRLDLFFKIYFKALYNKENNKNINSLYEKIIKNEKKFKKTIEDIKNFKMIENIFK